MYILLLPLALAGRKPDGGWLDSVISTVGLGDRLHHVSEISRIDDEPEE